MTYQEIIDTLKEKKVTVEQFAHNDFTAEFFLPEEIEAQDKADKFYDTFKDLDRNSEEFKTKLEEYYEMPNKYTLMRTRAVKALGLGEIQTVDSYGGEGKGEIWYTVKHFPDHDVYIRIDGFYTSYEGVSFDGEWECCSEVKPMVKTITVYE